MKKVINVYFGVLLALGMHSTQTISLNTAIKVASGMALTIIGKSFIRDFPADYFLIDYWIPSHIPSDLESILHAVQQGNCRVKTLRFVRDTENEMAFFLNYQQEPAHPFIKAWKVNHNIKQKIYILENEKDNDKCAQKLIAGKTSGFYRVTLLSKNLRKTKQRFKQLTGVPILAAAATILSTI